MEGCSSRSPAHCLHDTIGALHVAIHAFAVQIADLDGHSLVAFLNDVGNGKPGAFVGRFRHPVDEGDRVLTKLRPKLDRPLGGHVHLFDLVGVHPCRVHQHQRPNHAARAISALLRFDAAMQRAVGLAERLLENFDQQEQRTRFSRKTRIDWLGIGQGRFGKGTRFIHLPKQRPENCISRMGWIGDGELPRLGAFFVVPHVPFGTA